MGFGMSSVGSRVLHSGEWSGRSKLERVVTSRMRMAVGGRRKPGENSVRRPQTAVNSGVKRRMVSASGGNGLKERV